MDEQSSITISLDRPNSEEARKLIEELDAELLPAGEGD
jgi:hypothetical protein